MEKRIKIIYIAGSGRSGSTILESVLGNIDRTLSVGECNRFWERFYKAETYCGCGKKIEVCELWSQIHNRLIERFPDYDIIDIKKRIQKINKFSNFKNLRSFIRSEDWTNFNEIIKFFYSQISKISGNKVIIDSSKSPNWVQYLSLLDFSEIKIIHLERKLEAVANSWKKTKVLNEFYDRKVLMPIKSNRQMLIYWFKRKLVISKMKRNIDILEIAYEELCQNLGGTIKIIADYTGMDEPIGELVMPKNHGIAGNPVRNSTKDKIVIYPPEEKYKNLTLPEKWMFSMTNRITGVFLN